MNSWYKQSVNGVTMLFHPLTTIDLTKFQDNTIQGWQRIAGKPILIPDLECKKLWDLNYPNARKL